MTSVIRGDDNFDSEGIVEGTASAWVNFNGSGTVAIRDSYNVSSITDIALGNYTINFATAMANTDYVVGAMSTYSIAFPGGQIMQDDRLAANSTSSATVAVITINGSAYSDTSKVMISIFGGK